MRCLLPGDRSWRTFGQCSAGRVGLARHCAQAGEQRIAFELRDIVGEAGIAPGLDRRAASAWPTARSSAVSARGRRRARRGRSQARPCPAFRCRRRSHRTSAPASRSRSASAALATAVTSIAGRASGSAPADGGRRRCPPPPACAARASPSWLARRRGTSPASLRQPVAGIDARRWPGRRSPRCRAGPADRRPSSMSSRSSTTSTISSTIRPMVRSRSANTSTGWRRLVRYRGRSDSATSGISLPRYWVTGLPHGHSRSCRASISSSRATRPAAPPSARSPPARNSSIAVLDRPSRRLGAAPGRRRAWLSAAGDHAGGAGDAVGIQDHDHRAVAEDGVAAEHRDVAQDRRHRLHHDLLGVEHPVDDDAERVGADLGDDDMSALASVSAAPSPSSSLSDTSGSSRSRRRSTGVSLIRSITLSTASCSVELRRPRRARTSSTTLICGMAKRSPPALDDQRRDDGQGQRDLDGEGGALAGACSSGRWCRRSSRCWSSPHPCRRRGRTRR